MKKTVSMFAVLMTALCVGIGFAGCSKDTLNSLEGTAWVFYESGDDWSTTVTLEFESEENGVYTWEEIDGKQKLSGSSNFTYIYESPHVSIDVYGFTMLGVVSGNKMTFIEDEATMVFIRE